MVKTEALESLDSLHREFWKYFILMFFIKFWNHGVAQRDVFEACVLHLHLELDDVVIRCLYDMFDNYIRIFKVLQV